MVHVDLKPKYSYVKTFLERNKLTDWKVKFTKDKCRNHVIHFKRKQIDISKKFLASVGINALFDELQEIVGQIRFKSTNLMATKLNLTDYNLLVAKCARLGMPKGWLDSALESRGCSAYNLTFDAYFEIQTYLNEVDRSKSTSSSSSNTSYSSSYYQNRKEKLIWTCTCHSCRTYWKLNNEPTHFQYVCPYDDTKLIFKQEAVYVYG